MNRIFGLSIPQTLEEMCHPLTTAVIVYDMQVGVLNQIRNGPEIVAKVAEVLAAARRGGYRVFYTRYMTLPPEAAGVAQLRMAMAWQHVASPDLVTSLFRPDSPGFQVAPEIAPRSTEAVFDRITLSAFEGNPLPIALRDLQVQSVVILGVALEVGIEPSVRHAADLCFLPIVVTDACGAGNAAAAARSLESLRFAGDAVFTDVASISAHFTRRVK